MMTGAQAMVQCLLQEETRVIFGYPGATIAPFYNSLLDADIRHILTRTEQGAGHAANGYARISGRPGVCVATSGPGATNLLTAIATANSDSIPLVAITGQVPTYQLGRDVFQEVDTTGAAAPFTKYSYLLKDAGDIARVFKEAFHIASTGRKGPVLIDVPVDVQKQRTAFHYPKDVAIRGYKPSFSGHPRQIRKVAEAISAAEKPLICCGGGVFLSGAVQPVRAFCEKTGIPMVSTMMGIGILPADHPLYFGMVGQSGIQTANKALRESDLIVLIGARVGDRAIAKPGSLESAATIVHIDIDTAEIGKNIGTTIPLVGDAAQVVEELLQIEIAGRWDGWVAQLSGLCKTTTQRETENDAVDPNAFVRALCQKLPPDVIYLADVGQNQIWSARNFSGRGRFLTTGGMGTMGYSLPAAIGAKLAAPQRLVLAVCGDGSFQMSMNELATMMQHEIPVKIVIMRNGVLGMVREIQKNNYAGRQIGIDLSGSPDFGTIAEAYGMEHHCISRKQDCDAGIDRMLQAPGAFLLECVVDPEERTT